ncbi:MAG: hypothetical protein WA085_02435 [Sphingobium sp.]|uniref:hypothetical protein n=1 Tax=Sphingobium sp. CECT 9361 TaxID=2845384 RepID=UPI001E429D32|nr:hypothetical protein [Sphingobium sp. CECT 9361]CAH0355247.1 hypothetical protein SPH9361_03322 [Sphingobium sp. CECT 9361]
MIPRVLIDTAEIPGAFAEGGGQLKLFRRGDEFSIMLGGNELMNSRLSSSEEALATLACARLAGKTGVHMAIGGLGMGFTLRAALHALPADARIVVAELVPSVIAWAKGPMAEIFGDSLSDPRLAIAQQDVGVLIDNAEGSFDAILLDVDNGPDGLTRASNDRLYGAIGLARARKALRAGGLLLIWSSGPSPMFTARLKNAGFIVEEQVVRATRSGRGARHIIWIATAP